MLFWSVMGASIASALVPLINIEAILVVSVSQAGVRSSTVSANASTRTWVTGTQSHGPRSRPARPASSSTSTVKGSIHQVWPRGAAGG